MVCDFDTDWCGFSKSVDYKWVRGANATETEDTGPSGDHTSGRGYYLYIDATSPNNPYRGPFIIQKNLDEHMNKVEFYYFMYGIHVGTLDFDVSSSGADWTTIWSKSGEQGNEWFLATVSLPVSSKTFPFPYSITK